MASDIVVRSQVENLARILGRTCSSLLLITGRISIPHDLAPITKHVNLGLSLHSHNPGHTRWLSCLLQFLKIAVIDMRICFDLARLSPSYDIVLFYVGGPNLALPIISSRLLGKRTIVSVLGRASMTIANSGGGHLVSSVFSALERIGYLASDRILVESKSATKQLKLDEFKDKVIDSGARYVDTDEFRIQLSVDKRRNTIGYVGRLDKGKGVQNLLDSIGIVMREMQEIDFIIIGDGPARNYMEQSIRNCEMEGRVNFLGWVPHDDIPAYLNQMKLLVLPSYSEGLPTIVLEAMACGTPVLATTVGGIPDVIRDEFSGFLMEDSSPSSIAENIIRALGSRQIPQIIENAKRVVQEEFSYEAAVRRYSQIVS